MGQGGYDPIAIRCMKGGGQPDTDPISFVYAGVRQVTDRISIQCCMHGRRHMPIFSRCMEGSLDMNSEYPFGDAGSGRDND